MEDKNLMELVWGLNKIICRKYLVLRKLRGQREHPRRSIPTISCHGMSTDRFQYLSSWANPSAIHFLWYEPTEHPDLEKLSTWKKTVLYNTARHLTTFTWVDEKDPFLNLKWLCKSEMWSSEILSRENNSAQEYFPPLLLYLTARILP